MKTIAELWWCSLLSLVAAVSPDFGCFDADPNETQVDQEQCDCNCAGPYDVLGFSVPDGFDCGAEAHTIVDLEAVIDPCYQGLSILWFELQDTTGKRYKSNSLAFYSNQAGVKNLAFGGSIPTGTYELWGRMVDFQATSQCDDSICAEVDKYLQSIEITSCPAPTKTMQIEYAYQESDASAPASYDVFQCSTVVEQMDIAFSAANTAYWISSYPCVPTILVGLSVEDIRLYIGHIKATWEMFLCGIKGFKDANGNYIRGVLGSTRVDTTTFLPDTASGSLVAIKACFDAFGEQPEACFNDFVSHVVIHELGHQRAIASHDEHTPFCVMNRNPVETYQTHTVSRIWNPYFCPSCIATIDGINWEKEIRNEL
jgi:hypothetical protein